MAGAWTSGARAASVAVIAAGLLTGVAAALDGVVRTPAGAPVAGARVQVLGRAATAVTDGEGRFRLEPDPTPPFVLLVSRPDGVALRPVAVNELPSGPLEVQLAPFASEEVAVISGAAPDLELPPAAAFTLTGRADLEARAPAQLFQVLETVPGAGRVGDGLAAVPSLRGLASSRTLILLDEGRVSAERRAGPSATFLDPATVEEVEVVRGPGAVAYGSDAFGGVIRIRTRIPAYGEPERVRYELAAADATGELSGAFEVTTSVGGGGLLVGAAARRFDDYESPSGQVPVSGGRSRSFRLGYQRAVAGGALRLLWRSDLADDVGKPASDSGITRTSYPEERSHRLAVQYDRGAVLGFSRLSLAATWDDYRLVTDKETVPQEGTPRQIVRADVAANDWGLRAEGERPVGRARLVVGFDGSGRFNLFAANDTILFAPGEPCCATGASREVSIADADRSDLGVFASLGAGLGWVELFGGVRYDTVGSSTSGGYFGNRHVRNGAVSGFAGATLPLGGGLSLALQAARGFREPLLSDRYYRGVTGRGFITGNPDLRPETSLQFDAAIRFATPGASVALYAFAYRIDDLIERYRSGRDYAFRNRGAADVRGVEVEAAVELGGGLVCRFGGQALRGEVREDGAPIDDVPPLGGFVTVQHALGTRWRWQGRLAVYARDDRPGPSERVTPGFTVVDMGVAYQLHPAVELSLGSRNLLDREYPASPDARSVAAPGRTWRLAVRGVL